MQLHAITEQSLPRICFVDARTGAMISDFKGHAKARDLSTTILEFLDQNSLESFSAPKTVEHKGEARSKALQRDIENFELCDEGDFAQELSFEDEQEEIEAAAAATAIETRIAAATKKNTGSSSSAPIDAYFPLSAVVGTTTEVAAATVNAAATTAGAATSPALRCYGAPPPEPEAGDKAAIKIAVKLPSGKVVKRAFARGDLVRDLYAVAAAALVQGQGGGEAFPVTPSTPSTTYSASPGSVGSSPFTPSTVGSTSPMPFSPLAAAAAAAGKTTPGPGGLSSSMSVSACASSSEAQTPLAPPSLVHVAPFELMLIHPSRCLLDLQLTLEEEKLAGSQVIMRTI